MLDEKKLYNDAIKKKGLLYQKATAIEECGELIQEITKDLRGNLRKDKLSFEMADVEISLEVLKECYGNHHDVAIFKQKKLQKFKKIIEGI